MLRIYDFDGPATATNSGEVERALAKRDEDDANAFWIFLGEDEHPVMSVVVKGQLASLTFTPKKNEAGYRSVGNTAGLAPGQQSMFYIAHGEPHWVLNDSIIPVESAVVAAKELLTSSELPKSVEWLAL